MSLSKKFTTSVLGALKVREEKALWIATQLEAFLDWGVISVGKTPLPTHSPDIEFYKMDETFHEKGLHALVYGAYEDKQRSELKIEISSAGMVNVVIEGLSLAPGGKRESFFDMDAYKEEEVASKILALIEYDDLDTFGPFIREIGKRYWIEELKWAETSAPGSDPFEPSLGN